MLVLSRKQNQRVVFPNLGITLEVLRISGNTVRVGIVAPQSIPILRGELVEPDSAELTATCDLTSTGDPPLPSIENSAADF